MVIYGYLYDIVFFVEIIFINKRVVFNILNKNSNCFFVFI